MKTNEFENGTLYINGKCVKVEELKWNEHPTFKGAFLKQNRILSPFTRIA